LVARSAALSQMIAHFVKSLGLGKKELEEKIKEG